MNGTILPPIIIGKYEKDSEIIARSSTRRTEPVSIDYNNRYGYISLASRVPPSAPYINERHSYRYNQSQREKTDIGQLKKLKEFLCEEDETNEDKTIHLCPSLGNSLPLHQTNRNPKSRKRVPASTLQPKALALWPFQRKHPGPTQKLKDILFAPQRVRSRRNLLEMKLCAYKML